MLVDKLLTGAVRARADDAELAATMDVLDRIRGAVEAGVEVGTCEVRETTGFVGKTLLLETFDAPMMLVRPTPITIMPSSESSIVAMYSYRFKP